MTHTRTRVRPLLLGLHGRKGSGKDTVATVIEQWALGNYVFVKRGFADLLKWSVARLFWPEISMQGAVAWADEAKNDEDWRVYLRHEWAPDIVARVTLRQFLQRAGTEAHRDIFGPNFWVDQLLPLDEKERLREWMRTSPLAPEIQVITDLRFENEAERIHELGGHVILVDADERQGVNEDSHSSEKRLPAEMIDFVFYNNGTVHELHEDVWDFLGRAPWLTTA